MLTINLYSLHTSNTVLDPILFPGHISYEDCGYGLVFQLFLVGLEPILELFGRAEVDKGSWLPYLTNILTETNSFALLSVNPQHEKEWLIIQVKFPIRSENFLHGDLL